MVSFNAKEAMLARAARDIAAGMTVNLGIGLPTEVLRYIPKDLALCLHSENGITGTGPVRGPAFADRNLIDAGGAYVSAQAGTAFFDSALSFALVRSGRLDLTLLGAFEVAANGDLANWIIPGKFSPGMGGAIELAQKARRVGVIMTHVDRKGNPKILEACTLPLTAKGKVSRIYSDMAVMDVTPEGLALRELAQGVSLAALRDATAAPFQIPTGDCPRF